MQTYEVTWPSFNPTAVPTLSPVGCFIDVPFVFELVELIELIVLYIVIGVSSL